MIRMMISSKNILRELDFFETLYFQILGFFPRRWKKMAAIYANNMKENAMQKDALAYLRFVNQKKGKTYFGTYTNIALPRK